MVLNNKAQEKLIDLLQALAVGIMDIRAELGAEPPTFQEYEAVSEPPAKDTLEIYEPSENQLTALGVAHDQTTSEIDSRKEELSVMQDALVRTSRELAVTEESLRDIQAIADEAQMAQAEIEGRKLQALEDSARLEARALELNELEMNLAERERLAVETLELVAKSKDWVKSLLPRWSEENDFSSACRAMIEDAKGGIEPNSACAGLFATSLAGYSFALRDPDDRNLADAVRDVGRRLFTWLRVRGTDVSQAAEIARAIAAHINDECSGRCDVEVPTPGGPAQNQTMLFQPRPGTSDQTVVTVQSWCVRGAKREVIHRASINL